MSPESQHNRRFYDIDTTATKTHAQIGEGIAARNTRERAAGRKGQLQLRGDDDRDAVLAGIMQHFEDQIGDPAELPEETPMAFDDLSALLTPQGVDLTKELEAHISFMVNGGALPESGAETYKQQFSTIYVRTEELAQIPEGYRPMLFIDNVTPAQAAEKFITTPGINLYEYSTLANFNRVNPHTGKPRKNQTPSGRARLTFTPNVTSLTQDLTGKSANNRLEQMQNGARYLQPQQWFQLFNEGLQRAIMELQLSDKPWKNMTAQEQQETINNKRIDSYLPDASTWTQCPEWRDANGDVLFLCWSPDYRWVGVGYDSADAALPDFGARPAFG